MRLAAIAALVSCVSFWSHSANAVPYILHFTATNFFDPIGGESPPDDPVSGSLVFDKSAANFSIISLTSIDLTIVGHTYALSEVDFVNNIGADVLVGGILDVGGGTDVDDFWIRWNRTTGAFSEFIYSCPGCATFRSEEGSTIFIDAVPLPAGLPLFASGLGLLGLLEWRRRRRSAL
jgi:hypothetical protein